ncbi:MAG TPA: DUF899 domain-containing protein [Phycisphaerales bacterium]|nr:DUF899 domain-containing protein [Phycisphaerales bacterium]
MPDKATSINHKTGTREQWLAARLDLLRAEKEFTRRGDELTRRRQELPWVRIDKEYRFETDQGTASLKDLFRGRSQLVVYHFMFGPAFKTGCPACSAIADSFNGIFVHLEGHDVAFSAISRAPLTKLQAFKRRMGWTFPWASSSGSGGGGSDFNSDFNVSITEEQQRKGDFVYNFQRDHPTMKPGPDPGPATFGPVTGTDPATYAREGPGMSAFALKDDVVYHTYSTYERGLDPFFGFYAWLDRAPLGRNEKGGVAGGLWYRYHDEYDKR